MTPSSHAPLISRSATFSPSISSSLPPPGRQPWTALASGLRSISRTYWQPLEAQQFIKGAQGKGQGSHEWTCRWCDWNVVATSITELRHHILGTSTQVRKCTSKGQAFMAVREQLLGVHQQQRSEQEQQQQQQQGRVTWAGAGLY